MLLCKFSQNNNKKATYITTVDNKGNQDILLKKKGASNAM